MFPELLVSAACLNKVGCSETTSAYAAAYPEIVNTLQQRSNQFTHQIPPAVGAISATLLHGEAVFRLDKYFKFKLSNTEVNIQFSEDL